MRINSCRVLGGLGEAPGNRVSHDLALAANSYTEHFIDDETSISFVPLLDNLGH